MTTNPLWRGCFGEFLGTFLLVLFGTSTVAVTVLFKAHVGLLQVAGVWGMGVTLAIYATRHLSCAHLNPAVSLGMVLANRMRVGILPWYVASQLLGGIAAGGVVLLLFGDSISAYEAAHQITRGAPESVGTAMMFGEYFPNPGVADVRPVVTMATAALAEGFGTFLLVLLIFVLTEGCNVGRPASGSTPVFIGAAVATIISILAPLTQAGLNPARDFGPRLVAFLAGWKGVAIPGPRGGFFMVYILAPLLGGAAAALCFRLLVSRLMGAPAKSACGKDGSCDTPAASRGAEPQKQGDS
ncbi:MAG: aquaporin [Planctomycetota bacterium]|nr:aquaporin [Planctomycetota bacterium]